MLARRSETRVKSVADVYQQSCLRTLQERNLPLRRAYTQRVVHISHFLSDSAPLRALSQRIAGGVRLPTTESIKNRSFKVKKNLKRKKKINLFIYIIQNQGETIAMR